MPYRLCYHRALTRCGLEAGPGLARIDQAKRPLLFAHSCFSILYVVFSLEEEASYKVRTQGLAEHYQTRPMLDYALGYA